MTDQQPTAEQPGASSLPTLADRVNWLVHQVHPPGRGPYSNYEIAALIEKVTGDTVSHNAIWKLRNGQAANPTMRLVDGLAQAFGVPAGFFFGEHTIPEDQIELLALIRDSGITAAQLRAFAELTPEGRHAIAELIRQTTHVGHQPARRERAHDGER